MISPHPARQPVGPRRKRTFGFGLLAGLVLGSGGALVIDRRSDCVYSSDELLPQPACPLLKRLSCHGDEKSIDAWRSPIQLLADGPLAGDGSVALIPVGTIATPASTPLQAACVRPLGAIESFLSAVIARHPGLQHPAANHCSWCCQT